MHVFTFRPCLTPSGRRSKVAWFVPVFELAVHPPLGDSREGGGALVACTSLGILEMSNIEISKADI